jgi:transposase
LGLASVRDLTKEFKLDWHAVKTRDKQYMADQIEPAKTPGPTAFGVDEIPILVARPTVSWAAA